MNITNLIVQLQNKVNDLTYNQLAVAASIELLKTGQANYVRSVAELPSASASNGYLYYVKSLGLYFSNGIIWQPIDINNTETTAQAWGYNGFGQLGDNSVTNRSSPVTVVGGFLNWCQVSVGRGAFTLGVRQNGTAWAWGCNGQGQLGDNTTTSTSSPVSVVGGFTDWCQVSAGVWNSLGVRQPGSLWAWGCNTQGQLGDNTVVSKSSPVSVIGGFTDWCQAAAGTSHSLAVRQNGTLWAWGSNSTGQLGDYTSVSKSSPVSVVGEFINWCQVSAGQGFSLGLRQNGTVWSWGSNGGGQLGINSGTTQSRSSPVSVVGGFTDWCRVDAGDSFSLALRSGGTLWAWGANSTGQLGDNSVTNRSSPVSVVGGFTNWCQVSGGGSHTLGTRQNGTLWAWGNNATGQLGDNTVTSRLSPVSVIGGFTDWCQASAGNNFSLALRKQVYP